jgi:hypothetical protein
MKKENVAEVNERKTREDYPNRKMGASGIIEMGMKRSKTEGKTVAQLSWLKRKENG